MHEPYTVQRESSPTAPSLASQAAGLAPAPDRRSTRRQRRRRQSVEDTRPRGGPRCSAPPSASRRPSPALGRAARPPARTLATGARSVWLSGRAVDPGADRRGDSARVGDSLPSPACRPPLPGHSVEPATARPARPPARRRGDGPVARGDLARQQQGAAAPPQTILCIDESGFSPLPGVVRTDAPVGHTPIVRGW
jgi:hypothetical protein